MTWKFCTMNCILNTKLLIFFKVSSMDKDNQKTSQEASPIRCCSHLRSSSCSRYTFLVTSILIMISMFMYIFTFTFVIKQIQRWLPLVKWMMMSPQRLLQKSMNKGILSSIWRALLFQVYLFV